MFNRLFKLPKSLSFFLFGARATGKSTLLSTLFSSEKVIWYDLLDLDLEARFQTDPMSLLRELKEYEAKKEYNWVIIDEIQKAPHLLDVIHKIIEQKRFKFALSGSSARKLKRGAANLLAGRALENYLFPLTHVELKDDFNLENILKWGSLPEIFRLDDEKSQYLRTYSNTYLKEEIQAEQIIRKLPPFRLFLEIAANESGKIINYSKIARDIGSDPVSVKSYFQILEDTLLGFRLPPFNYSIRKRQLKSSKFYFFDLGVQSALRKTLHIPVEPRTYTFGKLFEQFLILEIYRLNYYYERDWRLSYLRTKDNVEVDLVIERPGMKTALIEIKSTTHITEEAVSSFAKLGRDVINAELYCFSNDTTPQNIRNVHCLHWCEGLKAIDLTK